MRSVRLFLTALFCALSMGVVLLPAGIEGTGQPIAGIQGSGLVGSA